DGAASIWPCDSISTSLGEQLTQWKTNMRADQHFDQRLVVGCAAFDISTLPFLCGEMGGGGDDAVVIETHDVQIAGRCSVRSGRSASKSVAAAAHESHFT